MSDYQITDLVTHATHVEKLDTALRPVHLLTVPYVSQLGPGADRHPKDCGAASGLMVLKAYKTISMTTDQFFETVKPAAEESSDCLAIDDIRGVLRAHGILTAYKDLVTEVDVFTWVRENRPVIALYKYEPLRDGNYTERKDFTGAHFSVIVGMDTNFVYVHDPYYSETNGEARPYPLDVFMKGWIDVARDPLCSNPERAAIVPNVGIGEISAAPETAIGKARVEAPLNVRNGPGPNFESVASLQPGATIDVYKEQDGWGEIEPSRWIRLKFTTRIPE